mmetsp:Transcript_11681/g.11723  ORF Transcript_11681/g.11723 Transcript_11681/m.11723 type:complete len:104 (-) Transcript_11681:171-482(-)
MPIIIRKNPIRSFPFRLFITGEIGYRSLSQLNQYQSKFNSDPNFPTVQHDGPISQPISSRKQQDQLVDNMMRYVPLGADECRFYLECVQWDLEAALKTYYDTK